MNVTSTPDVKGNGNDSNVMQSPGNDAGSLKNEFMTLMIAQLQNQDPTDPVDSSEYVTQLAQFAQVESLEQMRLNQATQMVIMENLGIVQSAQLIGKEAMVPASELTIDEEVIQGKVYSDDVVEGISIDIIDSNGEIVATLELGPQEKGDIAFSIDPEALGIPPGEYTLEANTTSGDDVLTADTFIQATIEKIHFISASGMMMAELGHGLGTVSVLEISEVS